MKNLKHPTYKGLAEAEKETLTTKYQIPEELKAPVINPQALSKLKENKEKAIKKDEYREDAQKLISRH